MKKIRLYIVGLMAMALMASCATRKSAISDLRSLSNDIEQNGASYSLKDWKNAATDYVKVNKKLTKYAGEYTQEERQEIAQLQGKCVKNFTTGAVTETTSRVENAVETISEIFKGVKGLFGK